MSADTLSRVGPSSSQREIFDQYHGLVRSFFRNRGFSDEETSDLTQEALLRVFKNMDKLRSPAARGAWVLRIASNIYKNELRYRKAGKRAGQEVPLDATPEGMASRDVVTIQGGAGARTPLDDTLLAERLQAVAACIGKLPPRMRQCLLFYADQERKYQEIADLLHISIESVKAHIHQARLRLRECMARKLGGEA
jgi:RNA polymerase sigma-70 factor (ECF subfamily)